MISIKHDLILFDKDLYLMEVCEVRPLDDLNRNHPVYEILRKSKAFGAELVLVVNGVKNSLCTFQYNVGSKQWVVVSKIIKDVNKKDILWAKKTFMQSENPKAYADKYWSLSDLKKHFSAAKNNKENPRPNKNQNTKSVEGMLEYLLSIWYIDC